MSVYNGFATRQQELMYSKALYNTVFLLQLRIYKLFKGEKFDDIKFGKVLTKLYARLFSIEEHKYQPPKYSFALKDLAVFLGIFEVSEDDLKAQRMNLSETGSDLSNMTRSAFNPRKPRGLDIIKEDQEQKDDEDEESRHGDEIEAASSEISKDHAVLGIKVGEKVKSGVNSYVKPQTTAKGSVAVSRKAKAQTSHGGRGETNMVNLAGKLDAQQVTNVTRKNKASTNVKASEKLPGRRLLEPLTTGANTKRSAAVHATTVIYGGVSMSLQEAQERFGAGAGNKSQVARSGSREELQRTRQATSNPTRGGVANQARSLRQGQYKSNLTQPVRQAQQQQQNARSIGDKRGSVTRTGATEIESNKDKSDSNASHQSNFSNNSKTGFRRNATNSSRGSAWSQTSSIRRKQAFTSVGMHKAQMKRPQLPSHPRLGELTQANLNQQQRQTESSNYEERGRGSKTGGPESRGSKRSTTNQTTVSAKVGISQFESVPVGGGGPMSEHPDHGFNGSLLDANDFQLNGSIEDSGSNYRQMRPPFMNNLEVNAYAPHVGESASSVQQQSPTSFHNQHRSSITGALSSGGNKAQVRLSMSTQKNGKPPAASRTTEKTSLEESSQVHHPSRHYRDHARPKQQFSIAHLNREGGNHSHQNSQQSTGKRRIVSSSQSLKQRGVSSSQNQYPTPSEEAVANTGQTLSELESPHLNTNFGANESIIVDQQTLDLDGEQVASENQELADGMTLEEDGQRLDPGFDVQPIEITAKSKAMQQAQLSQKRSSQKSIESQHTMDRQNRNNGGPQAAYLVNQLNSQKVQGHGSQKQPRKPVITGEQALIKGKQPSVAQAVGVAPRELKPIADKKLAAAKMNSIYSQKVRDTASSFYAASRQGSQEANAMNTSIESIGATQQHNRRKFLPRNDAYATLDNHHPQLAGQGGRHSRHHRKADAINHLDGMAHTQQAFFDRQVAEQQQLQDEITLASIKQRRQQMKESTGVQQRGSTSANTTQMYANLNDSYMSEKPLNHHHQSLMYQDSSGQKDRFSSNHHNANSSGHNGSSLPPARKFVNRS